MDLDDYEYEPGEFGPEEDDFDRPAPAIPTGTAVSQRVGEFIAAQLLQEEGEGDAESLTDRLGSAALAGLEPDDDMIEAACEAAGISPEVALKAITAAIHAARGNKGSA